MEQQFILKNELNKNKFITELNKITSNGTDLDALKKLKITSAGYRVYTKEKDTYPEHSLVLRVALASKLSFTDFYASDI